MACEAYHFVTQQKKATYKEVARKLITAMGEEPDLDPLKRGEMNIKRRVYDALNVLIALGILKRNGNRITGKRPEIEEGVISDRSIEK